MDACRATISLPPNRCPVRILTKTVSKTVGRALSASAEPALFIVVQVNKE